jgi:Holliday junction DNA helicase RuvA
MIYYVQGQLENYLDNAVIVDCHGIGCLIYVASGVFAKLPAVGEPVKLYTYMQRKEDDVSLFGFLTLEERNMFSLLIGVTGVGPKAALAILSAMTPSQVMIAILSDDTAAFCKAPGVGKKTAQRISLELRDKIKAMSVTIEEATGNQQTLSMAAKERQDAADALIALGYSRGEAIKAVMEVALDEMRTEQIIRLALKRLAGGS